MKVLDIKVFFDPKKSEYRVAMKGKSDMPTGEVLEILNNMAKIVFKHDTMGEVFEQHKA